MPFPDLFTGTDAKFNNRQLWEKLDPSKSDMLPYIYDQFDTWGGETFNRSSARGEDAPSQSFCGGVWARGEGRRRAVDFARGR